MSGAVDTLFLPFASGDIDLPGKGERVAFLNAAVPLETLDGGLKSALVCEQGFRPDFLALQRAGFEALPELDANASGFAACLVLAGKHRGENHAMIARAARLVRPGGTVAVCGDKSLGISSLRKWVGDRAEISGSLAKHHATVFWFSAEDSEAFADAGAPQVLAEGRFETAPGMFSHAGADAGSALLAEFIDGRITGAVADFGCGWGYLAAKLMETGTPASVALFDAHFASLQAAGRNLASLGSNVSVEANWIDLTTEPVARRFDWIVMNPPFHAARAAEPDIGKAFIAAASKALKPGGRLLMVANRKLPYEQALAQGVDFREELTRD